ncbi:MAG: YhfZ family protein, partial [Spirochaetota bacterium]
GLQEFVGLMPLFQSRRTTGLATGVYQCFDDCNLPIHLLFSRGSANRVSTVLSGRADFCVMSRLAYRIAARQGEPILKLVEFQPRSYRSDFVLLVKRDAYMNSEELVLGADLFSHDHVALLDQLKERWDRKLKVLNYLHVELGAAMRRCELDAALVGEIDRESVTEECIAISLRTILPDYIEDANKAVLVAKSGNEAISALLKTIIAPQVVNKVQQDVLAGNRSARY